LLPTGKIPDYVTTCDRGKGGSAASAGWQVTRCDPIWHAGSCSVAVLLAQTAMRFLYLFSLP